MGRIISYDEKNGYNDGDYLLLDNATDGTKRIRADRVGIQLDPTLTDPNKAAPANAVKPVDATPTANSTNAVQSGGVKSTLDALQAQIPPIDPTLSQSGQAADAKETGDKITSLKEDIDNQINAGIDVIDTLQSALTNVYEVMGSVNVYNPALPTTTGWLTNTGAVDATGTGAHFLTTDYIPIQKNIDYIVKNVRVGYSGGSPGSRILVALYDASKNYIDGTYQNIVNVTPMQVSVSSGDAVYLRVSTLPAHLAASPQYGDFSCEVVYSGTDLTQYIPYSAPVYENRMQIVAGYGAMTTDEYNTDIAEKSSLIYETVYSKNLYDRNADLTAGWLIDTGAVDATGTGANFATTDYIPIEKSTNYIIANERMNIAGNVVGSRILMALYDADKNYISGSFQNVVNVSPMQVTFNSGDAVYLRVSTPPMHMGIPTSEFALIVQKGSVLDGYTTYWVKRITKLYPQDNILFGKKYVACGDSLTAGDFGGYVDDNEKTGIFSDAFSPEYGTYKTYPYWIALRNGMTLVNSGINGSVMAISKEYIDGAQSDINYRSPFSLQRYKDIPADADYITLWFGVNDKDHTYLGTISDTTNETFYGAWNVVLPYLMKNHPKAKIGIIITFGIPDSPYTQAVRDVAEKWGVPYFDFPRDKQAPIIIRNKDTGYAVDQNIVDWKLDKYSVSETNHHPNLFAHELESTCLEAWLRTL